MRVRFWMKASVMVAALCLVGLTAAAQQQTGDPVADAARKARESSEKAWRKRFQVQHDKIYKAERELDVLTRELEKAQIEYYPDPQKAMTQQNSRADINEAGKNRRQEKGIGTTEAGAGGHGRPTEK